MTRFPEGWNEAVARIARISAARCRAGSCFTYADRVDLAGGGIIEYLADNGWPDEEKPMYRAADNAIRREDRERYRHINHWSYWHEPPGITDAIGEAVTDRVAVWQVVWALTPGQWEAVWALAEVMKRGGGRHDAATLLGANVNAYGLQLSLARKRARALWVAPGDTPPRLWAADYKVRDSGSNTMRQLRRRTRERAQRKAAA